ncbi:hypothetical protein GQX73_g10557 [Xylaria multiplex]|uniref:Uncharacterized protein n=1 Tax=Xylaria multiplex TaxID=323545 RepID=A0A7C8MWX4_9PEZI|nr:hypothetical protein GQX73_g10557 [Xylaria multiplex]
MTFFRTYFNAIDVADEEKHLCPSSDFNPDESSGHGRKKPAVTKLSCLKVYIVTLHLGIIVLLAITASHIFANDTSMALKGMSWSPVQGSLQYELNGRHALKHHKSTPFSGPPTSQQEIAWAKILTPMYFAATEREMLSAGETVKNGAQLTGGDYLATLGVYHELHCLHQMRLFLYRERYYHNITKEQENYLREHLDHCMEALRITIMCHGNTGLYTFAWDSDASNKPTTKSNARSACVKWSSIKKWSYSRQLAESDHVVRPSYLQ